jgi:hypothetical protein
VVKSLHGLEAWIGDGYYSNSKVVKRKTLVELTEILVNKIDFHRKDAKI